MEITSVIQQKSSDDRYNIHIDGDFAFSASIDDVVKYSLKSGKIIDNDELENLIEACELSKAYNYALNLLSKRDYTTFELERKLSEKKYSSLTISKIVEKVGELNFIDDRKFAERYINDSINFKKYGVRKIQYKLMGKGIDSEILDDIEIDPEIQFQNALQLAIRKYERIFNEKNPKDKIFRYLLSKGYELEIIRKVMTKVFNSENFE